MRTFSVLTAATVVAGLMSASVGHAQKAASDWTQWRGPSRDGVIKAFTPPKVWPPQLTRKWKVEVGPGYATPLVVGARVFVFAREGDNEVLSALDAQSGKVVWKTPYAAPFVAAGGATKHGEGPKGTPAFANGKLYTLGISGILTAFDATNGKLLWQKPAPAVGPKYGTATSPLVDRGLVIVHVGGHDQGALTAFDANTGDVKWAWNGDGPGYASPFVAELGGMRQIIDFAQENLVGIDPANGALLWKQPFKNQFWTNIVTPVIYRDTVIISANQVGTRAYRVAKGAAGWTVTQAWANDDVQMNLSNPVLIGETLVGMSSKASGQFFAMDVTTGATKWKTAGREADNASIAQVGDVLLMLKDSGELVVARATGTGMDIVEKYTVADSATYGQPALIGNRLYVKDNSSVALWTTN